MKKLNKINLFNLNQVELQKKEMNLLRGGNSGVINCSCSCGCKYSSSSTDPSYYGGSSTDDNSSANHHHSDHSANVPHENCDCKIDDNETPL